MKNLFNFDQYSLNEKSQLEINKELLKSGKIKKEFEKFPCVLELPGYDNDKDGIVEVFGMDVQYFPDGTYKMEGKTGKYSCENGIILHDGKPVKGSAIKQVGPTQTFKPYDPNKPWTTTGANKEYLKKGMKDPKGSSLVLELQKKLRSLGYLHSDKFLTGNLGINKANLGSK